MPVQYKFKRKDRVQWEVPRFLRTGDINDEGCNIETGTVYDLLSYNNRPYYLINRDKGGRFGSDEFFLKGTND